MNSGSSLSSTCTIRLKHKDGNFREEVAVGDGPIQSGLHRHQPHHRQGLDPDSFELGAVTGGEDARARRQ